MPNTNRENSLRLAKELFPLASVDELIDISRKLNSYLKPDYRHVSDMSLVEFSYLTKLQHPIKGLIDYVPYDFQKTIMNVITAPGHWIINSSRQIGTTCLLSLLTLYTALHEPDRKIVLLTNRLWDSNELMSSVLAFYDQLPLAIKPKIVSRSKLTLSLDNGSSIIATSIQDIDITNATHLFVSEAAYISNGPFERFWPIVETSTTLEKIVLLSTPSAVKGLFYQLFTYDAHDQMFNRICLPWTVHPERDQDWADNMIAIMGMDRFRQEFCCEFI